MEINRYTFSSSYGTSRISAFILTIACSSTAVKIAGKGVSTVTDEVMTDMALDTLTKNAFYTTHMKLGLIGEKTYANEIAAYITKNYQSKNVAVTKEGNYYRVSADFMNKSAAIKACTDMRKKELIINYYVY